MKICVLISSYEGTGEEYTDVPDHYQDPSIWVTNHDFTLKYLTKANAVEVIKETVSEGYDFIWNFLWGMESYSVAGVEAIRYLESTKHPMLGPSSKYVSLTKLDFKIAAAKLQIPVPNWTTDSNLKLKGMKYPLIVKPADGYCSVHLRKSSVCNNEAEVMEQIKWLTSQTHNPCKDVLIEEFIIGEDFSCTVLETTKGLIPLQPLVYEYPEGSGELERFLDWESKVAPLMEGVGVKEEEVGYKVYMEEDEICRKVKEVSVRAFVALGVAGSGYARVDLRVKNGQVFVLEVNNTPGFFFPKGSLYGDDDVIEQSFPGGHAAVVDHIIASKKSLLKWEAFYDKVSLKYEETIRAGVNVKVWDEITNSQNFNGSVLDLGCGTGYIGNLILSKGNVSELVGIDASQEMANIAEKTYAKVHVGLMQNVLGELNRKFDHVVSYGVFPFVDEMNFEQILKFCFVNAKKSITLTVEDIPAECVEELAKTNPDLATYNNVPGLRKFAIPHGWVQDFWRYDFSWKSTTMGFDVFAVTVCYKRGEMDKENQ